MTNEMQSAPQTQTWSAAQYAANGRFVADMAGAVVGLLQLQAGERLLDLGCGDGALTERLAATGATVTGVDADTDMIAASRARGLNVRQAKAEELASIAEFAGAFDAVFSNAALHWIPEHRQPTALAGVHRVLRPGGRFVAEMGGLANIAAIRTALSAVAPRYGLDSELLAASFYPSAGQYGRMLTAAGFTVQHIEAQPRITPLPNGAEGMTHWLKTFRQGVFAPLNEADRDQAVAETVALLRPILADDTGAWFGDYVRLRFVAVKPTSGAGGMTPPSIASVF